MKKYLLILFIFLVRDVNAQNSSWRKRADQAFDKKDYATSAYYYGKLMGEGQSALEEKIPYFSIKQRRDLSKRTYDSYRLAESYRLSNNYQQAEGWYKEVLESDESSFPYVRFWYGICLRSNNQLEAAVAELSLFSEASIGNKDDHALATKELKNALFASEQYQRKPSADIVKLESSFSTEENDFSLSISGEKYWFTATSEVFGNGQLNQIFVSDRDSLSKKTAIDFNSDLKSAMHFGTPSLDSSGLRMYLTSWVKNEGKNAASVYFSKYEGGHWSIPKKLNSYVNSGGYNAMQPFVTPDGRHLYFVSDRRGGIGGNDIWRSELDAQGMPVNAQNLGNVINTPDDEGCPYFNTHTRKMVFSSKGFVGMGNFDLYESYAEENASWTKPRNLGAPYNSTKDDLYYYEGEPYTAFLSSDRDSECCLNLFKVKVQPTEREFTLFAGTVNDCATGLALAGVKVSVREGALNNTTVYFTDERGHYNFKIERKKAYELRFEKKDYFARQVSLPAQAKLDKDTLNHVLCLQMFEIDKPIVIENILYDFNKAILKPQSLIVLDELVGLLTSNPKIRIELSAHTDSIGPDWYNNRLSQQRAQSCVDYIILKGISPGRITAKGYGESRPIAPNSLAVGGDNKEGRRLNRRTEFKVVGIE